MSEKKPKNLYHPRSIADEWRDFRSSVYGVAPISPQQFFEVRNAFYAGFNAMLGSIMDGHQQGKTTDLRKLVQEVTEFTDTRLVEPTVEPPEKPWVMVIYEDDDNYDTWAVIILQDPIMSTYDPTKPTPDHENYLLNTFHKALQTGDEVVDIPYMDYELYRASFL